ncbi:aldehyde dehydrogenase family protein [Bdellovibrio sp. HCB2-146]|uniref:aldehyde dehydrogenase family protein n=1 Tax=Bdellovibrio sp. HCB2-146 TaxID=3394362 RepID=UPI0039BD108A
MNHIKNFIGGEFVDGEGGKTFTKVSSFDGETLATVSEAGAFDLIKSIQAGKKAFVAFETATREQRAHLLNSIATHFESNKNEIAFLEALYQGLPQEFVLNNSVEVAIRVLKETAQSLLNSKKSEMEVRSTGLIGIITPWSLSLRMVVDRLAPALAAGNAVVVKLSEQSPITTQILGEALMKAEVPAGLVNILNAPAEIGHMLAGHPGVRAVTAAGSNATMEAIATAGLKQFKKLQLSGSAKNSGLVLGDADFANNIGEILRPFLIGQAQTCWNVSRLFVLEATHKEFYEAAKSYLEKLTPSTGPKDSSPWLPLIAPKVAADLDQKLSLAKTEHGKILTGGEGLADKGFFHKPTVMIDLTNCSVIQQDEVQGPLLLVTPVKYQHEMLKWTNTSYLGQGAVVWGSAEKAAKVIPKLECQQVWLNSWMTGAEKSMFGHKQSSFGNPDMSWDGSFYSDVKSLTGL